MDKVNAGRAGVVAVKTVAIGITLSLLLMLAGYAWLRESRAPAPQPSAWTDEPQRAALSPAEEAYAAALWQIHAQVKQDAVRMTFAGLYYKMGEIDRAGVKRRVAPLLSGFIQAQGRTRRLSPPGSMLKFHDEYLQAIRLYVDASREMLRITEDADEGHLRSAQGKTQQASELLLKVGDVLWPGEYKPN